MAERVVDAAERFVALAIDVGVDEAAVAASGAPLPTERRSDQPVVAVGAAAMLSFSRLKDGSLRRATIRSVDGLAIGEADALATIDRHLGRHYYLGARLVAFDAVATLAILGRRARRHWLFDAFDYPRWATGGPGATFDAQAGWDRRDTLAEVCAAMGIKGAGALHARDHGFEELGSGTDRAPAHVRRAEAGAMGVALLMAHELAARAGSPVPLLKTWHDLLALVRGLLPRLDHCASFRCDGLVDPDIYSVVGVPVARRRRRGS